MQDTAATKNEVPVVIETAGKVVGIEVKSGSSVPRDALKGLLACQKVVGSYKPFEKIVAYTGERKMALKQGCTAVPYAVLLEELCSLA